MMFTTLIAAAFAGLLSCDSFVSATMTTKASTTTTTAATTTKSCNPVKTYHATFDNLPVGSAPKTGYASCGWPGFTVSNALPGAGVIPASPNNSIQANGPESSYFYSSVGVVFGLDTFSFACTASIPGEDSYFAAGCEIMVVGVPSTPLLQISSYGPFTFNVNYTQLEMGIPQKMARVKLGAESSSFYFFITSAAAGSQLYLDSLVIEQQNYCPS